MQAACVVAQEHYRANPYTEAEITECLMAVIAWAGNVKAAHRALTAEGKSVPTEATLSGWIREKHAIRYDELREKFSEQLEARLANEYRENARLALEAERLATLKAIDKLEAGKDQDPGRTAANMATVADKNTGKLLALTGRPTSIREDRNLEEILRGLVGKKILRVVGADDDDPPAAEVVSLPSGESLEAGG